MITSLCCFTFSVSLTVRLGRNKSSVWQNPTCDCDCPTKRLFIVTLMLALSLVPDSMDSRSALPEPITIQHGILLYITITLIYSFVARDLPFNLKGGMGWGGGFGGGGV